MMDAQSELLLAAILRETRVAALATLRNDSPQVSMVAILPADDFSAFYIHVSQLAQHTSDMMREKRVGLLIAETDDGRADPQTLGRVSLRAEAEMLQRGSAAYEEVKEKYIARFAQSAPMFQLGDFSIWRINPKGGRFVAGFAKAFNITPETLQSAARR